MGGNGPHNGPRDSALGLATLRMDGFAGLRATNETLTVTTKELRVSGDRNDRVPPEEHSTFNVVIPLEAESEKKNTSTPGRMTM